MYGLDWHEVLLNLEIHPKSTILGNAGGLPRGGRRLLWLICRDDAGYRVVGQGEYLGVILR